MNQQLTEITINGTTYVPKDSQPQLASRDGLPYVVVRTFSAGVHTGYLKSRVGKEVILLDSRRIWYWAGAATLSQLAFEGVAKPDECKFSVVVPEIQLTEAIEIIKTTVSAQKSIEGVKVWKV